MKFVAICIWIFYNFQIEKRIVSAETIYMRKYGILMLSLEQILYPASLKLHDQIDITLHQSIAAGRKQQLFGWPASKKKDPVFVINISSCSHKFTSLERKWDKKKALQFCKTSIPEWYFYKKAIWHLAIWRNWCFVQFHQSRIEFLKNCSAFLCLNSTCKRKIWENERKY